MTPVGGSCNAAPNCGNPTRNACIAAGGTWLFHIDCPTPLPIVFKDFSIENFENSIELNWTTASELENDFFTVEKSKDGSHWFELGTVKGNGSTTVKNNYAFTDESPYIGTSYYRLSQTDFNGTTRIITTEQALFESTKYLLYPIPVNKSMIIEGPNLSNSKIKIFSCFGEEIHVDSNSFGDKLSFDFSEVKNGAYIINIENERITFTDRIIVFHK
jgi:hypothetical protein